VTASPPPAFGLDVFGLDERLRLFNYATADNRLHYLWVLRAFDTARTNYHLLLHTTEVARALATLTEANPDCPDPAELELPRLLDQLVEWGCWTAARTAPAPPPWRSIATATRSTSSPRPVTGRTGQWRACCRPAWTTRPCPGWSSPTCSPT
jgi:hypothetical protein